LVPSLKNDFDYSKPLELCIFMLLQYKMMSRFGLLKNAFCFFVKRKADWKMAVGKWAEK